MLCHLDIALEHRSEINLGRENRLAVPLASVSNSRKISFSLLRLVLIAIVETRSTKSYHVPPVARQDFCTCYQDCNNGRQVGGVTVENRPNMLNPGSNYAAIVRVCAVTQFTPSVRANVACMSEAPGANQREDALPLAPATNAVDKADDTRTEEDFNLLPIDQAFETCASGVARQALSNG